MEYIDYKLYKIDRNSKNNSKYSKIVIVNSKNNSIIVISNNNSKKILIMLHIWRGKLTLDSFSLNLISVDDLK